MEHELHIGITADVLPGPFLIRAEGCLTRDSFVELITILDRGATFRGCPDLVVDLRKVDHVEPSALDAVERHIVHHNVSGGTPVMKIQSPQRCSEAAGGRRCQLAPEQNPSKVSAG